MVPGAGLPAQAARQPLRPRDDGGAWRPEPPATPWEPDPAGYTALFSVLDRAINASVARYTLGLSPRALWGAYLDWLGGIAFSPGKQAQLVHKAQRKWSRYLSHVQTCLLNPDVDTCCIEPLPQDHRFDDAAWQRPPFNMIYQGFLLTQQWWHNATTGVSGITPQDERAMEFAARQVLDVVSPSNFLFTNPVVLEATFREAGQNLVRGANFLLEDVQARIAGRGPPGSEEFRVGENIAATPGKVVYRNRLIELIQYAPTTGEVRPEPVLITPAWIMKYYILDLSPANSMVKHLVDQGFTVFMISWKNPDPDDRDLSMDDYLRLGPLAALEEISRIMPDRKTHAVGYCLGGTLLAIAAAALARDQRDVFASLTFLASQVDFEEAGELMIFINEKQIAFLEDLMWEQGFLDSGQMAGAFELLRSNDLVWSRMIQEYLLGVRAPMTDLMTWNADGTRMPYRMHSEYLERLFLRNDLSTGRYRVDERPVSLGDIRTPTFAVATHRDHIAPWRSVHKLHLLNEGEITFLLTSGGHNVGIVAGPNSKGRSYRVATRPAGGQYVDPDHWLEQTPIREGSWWPEWVEWLGRRSGAPVAPPPMGPPGAGYMPDAPGAYVRTP
jgi:polyhydroxyalkanoate synthase